MIPKKKNGKDNNNDEEQTTTVKVFDYKLDSPHLTRGDDEATFVEEATGGEGGKYQCVNGLNGGWVMGWVGRSDKHAHKVSVSRGNHYLLFYLFFGFVFLHISVCLHLCISTFVYFLRICLPFCRCEIARDSIFQIVSKFVSKHGCGSGYACYRIKLLRFICDPPVLRIFPHCRIAKNNAFPNSQTPEFLTS